MRSKRWRSSFFVIAPLVWACLGALAQPAPAPSDIIPFREVKAGMRGYGLTVVKGDAIERFDVEVIGTVPQLSPGRSTILVRLAGLGLEESGIAAGMSGSPVFLEGRLAGAVSSAWGFSKYPIGNVTPIESMLLIADEFQPPRVGPGLSTPARTGGATEKSAGVTRGKSGVAAYGAVLNALALPEEARLDELRSMLSSYFPPMPTNASSLLLPAVAGIPGESLARFPEAFSRLGFDRSFLANGGTALSGAVDAAAAGDGGAPGPLTEGSSISALLIDGDLRLGATGTVTTVLPGGRFIAFGHPFLGFGQLDLPVAPARIVSVLSSAFQSFKIGYPLRPVYRLTKDRDPGVAGRTDRTAPMVPVRFSFKSDGSERTMQWGVAPNPKLLPVLLAISTDAALTLSDPTPRVRTLRFRIAFETQAGPIAYEDEATGMRAKEIAILTAATLAGAVMDNDLEEPLISGVTLTLESSSGENRLKLLEAALASSRVAPGEDVVATVRLADRRGGELVRAVRVKVPAETAEGRAQLVISDGSTASVNRLQHDPAEPKTLADLAASIRRIVPSDQLVATLVVAARGASMGSGTISSMPPTAASLARASTERDLLSTRLAADAVMPLPSPMSGSVRLDVEIERPRS